MERDTMSKDFFSQKADSYDQNDDRVANVDNIANSILNKITCDKTMQIMDFGSGTGLLLERIAPYVKKIVAVDISKSMIQQLSEKRTRLDCELEIVEMDLSKSVLEQKFDGIISSMTMHHVENVQSMFEKFYSMLDVGGFIAIADLETEDGSFHTEDTGVFHLGFDKNAISTMAATAGFKKVTISSASTIHKPNGTFPVFLLTSVK